MSGKFLSFGLSSLILLSASFIATTADAASVTRTYRYFPVYGKTAEQLDQSLSKNGPKLGTGGASHPGATRIAFDARVKYRQDGKYCRISGVTANVEAIVTLPSWKSRRHATADTRLVWDTLVKDIRRHEESHIVIARSHASELERAIRSMRHERDCATLRHNVDKLTAGIFADHDKAQQYFDRVESVNFEKRFERLLTNNLEKRLQEQNTKARNKQS